jgi:hypothetical protein
MTLGNRGPPGSGRSWKAGESAAGRLGLRSAIMTP